MNYKQLDSYSLLIVSKYFESTFDYINIMCVCKKFKETTVKLRYNPIPITSLKLFPNIQTQYIYTANEERIKGIDQYEIWYLVEYKTALKLQQQNIKCHQIKLKKEDKIQFSITIDTLPKYVTNLSSQCFIYSTSLKTLKLPSNIKSIGYQCFRECYNLSHVELPIGLTKLGKHCFYLCTSLTSIQIPSTIQQLNEDCFCDCSSLKTVDIPDTVTSIEIGCFRACKSLQSIQFPPLLTQLNYGTCSRNYSLTKISIPPQVTSIAAICFACSPIKSFEIPSNVKSIGDKCFEKCTNLQSLIIPSSVTSIGNYCFVHCSQLSILSIPTTVKQIGHGSFENCQSLTKLSVPLTNGIYTFNCTDGDKVTLKSCKISY
ncbi:hypothetical protein QTN25_002110 [Entamoeba marina]